MCHSAGVEVEGNFEELDFPFHLWVPGIEHRSIGNKHLYPLNAYLTIPISSFCVELIIFLYTLILVDTNNFPKKSYKFPDPQGTFRCCTIRDHLMTTVFSFQLFWAYVVSGIFLKWLL